jgi:hypothetical protein
VVPEFPPTLYAVRVFRVSRHGEHAHC